MSKVKRQKRKQAARRRSITEQIARKKKEKAILGSNTMADRMIEFHQDILQNIEFALIIGYRVDSTVDDSLIAEALTAAIKEEEPNRRTAGDLVAALDEARRMREDVSDELWCNGLQTVLQSVRRHSRLQSGERNYIHFVSPFVL